MVSKKDAANRTYHDPVALVGRILRTGSREARAALLYTASGVLLKPIDLVLGIWEQKRVQDASVLRHPLVFVVGPPRSGTTVVYQSLVKALPVSYFNNLTSVFPRSPITVTRLSNRPFRNSEVDLKSYYGRTASWWKPNDGLYLWDRWLGSNRRLVPKELLSENRDSMIQFFGAWTREFDRPLINKNNALNHSAHLVADALPSAHFICLNREPVYLAQSLLRARQDIHGAAQVPYGVDSQERPKDSDPIRDVCLQVRFHAEAASRQTVALGETRFWNVSYEEFCKRPARLAARVGKDIFGIPVEIDQLDSILSPLPSSRRQALPDYQFNRLIGELRKLDIS